MTNSANLIARTGSAETSEKAVLVSKSIANVCTSATSIVYVTSKAVIGISGGSLHDVDDLVDVDVQRQDDRREDGDGDDETDAGRREGTCPLGESASDEPALDRHQHVRDRQREEDRSEYLEQYSGR